MKRPTFDRRLAQQFPIYIRFVLKQQWVKKWQHIALLLFPIAFYILLVCLKVLLLWMTKSPIPLSFVDKLLSMLKIPFASEKTQKQFLSLKVSDPAWDPSELTDIYPNYQLYQKLDGQSYLDASSYEIARKAAVVGPIELIDLQALSAVFYYRDVPVHTSEKTTLQDDSLPSFLGTIYSQWQKTFAPAMPQLAFKSIGWIDIPDVDYITRNLVNDSAYLLFIFINHILLPLTIVDMVNQRVVGFTNLLRVSGLKATVYYVANFVFYYIYAVILGIVNYVSAVAFGLSIKEQPLQVLVITLFFPFYELPLAFLLSFCFSSVFTASVVMWFGIVLVPQMLALLANAVAMRQNVLAWILPSASIVYINSKNPEMLEKRLIVTVSIACQSVILFGIAISAIAILNYGQKLIAKRKIKKAKLDKATVAVPQENEIPETESSPANPITIEQISKYFGKRKNNLFCALDQVSFTVEENEIKGLIGHNGSGKTTLMNIITGTSKQTTGNYAVQGFICYCPQMDSLPNDFIAGDIIQLFADLRLRQENSTEMSAENLVRLMKVESCLKQKIKTCSYGNKRKIQLISSAVNSLPKDIILLDEVTTNLSRNDVIGVWDILKHFKASNSSVLFVSHDLDEVQILCDKVIMLKQGKVILNSDPKAVIQDEQYDAIDVLEPIDAEQSIQSLNYQPYAQLGRYWHYIIKGNVRTLSSDIVAILRQNEAVVKSADLETVFEQIQASE